MRQEIRLLQGAVVALCLVTIGVMLSCGGSSGALAIQPPGIPTPYGDGSAGVLNIVSSTTLEDGNTQYSSISITGAGVVVNVHSGTVLRCTGTFTVGAGATLSVATGGIGGALELDSNLAVGTVSPQTRAATQGQAASAAMFPEVGDTSEGCNGGGGGIGLGSASKYLRYPGHNAGGAGAGSCSTQGGEGGGGLTVLAFGAIDVAGTLRANGAAGFGGSGGGAGGVIVLASATSITTTGGVTANGNNGGASGPAAGAGGAGGGGVINLLAPSIAGADGVNYVVAGGTQGSNATNATNAFRSGGAGGGACGGNGGFGGSLGATDISTVAGGGDVGNINRIITANPSGLFP
jgi:hypothetical protein